jgi:hypothetical protein
MPGTTNEKVRGTKPRQKPVKGVNEWHHTSHMVSIPLRPLERLVCIPSKKAFE